MISSCAPALLCVSPFCFAQSPQNSAPPLPDKGSSTVSAHELRIPQKARDAFNKGTELLTEQKSAESIAEFQRAIKAFPDFYEAYYKIGIAQLNLQQQREAEAAFEKSIELSAGRYPPPQFGLGVTLCLQKKFAEAEEAVHSGVELDPTDAAGQFALAWVLFNAGRLPESEKSVRQAILYNANFATAYLLLAQIHLRSSDTSALVSDLDAYLRLDPDGPHSAEAKAVRTQAQELLAKQQTTSPVVAQTPKPQPTADSPSTAPF